MNLSNNFTLEELTFSDTAIRKGLDNSPDADTTIHLTELAQNLERVQRILGFPLHINSAYRSPKVNMAVGGSNTSAHCLGYAADFTCKAFGTPLEICKELEGKLDFDQLIQEGAWVHISIDPRMRKEVLTAHFQNGKVNYTLGLA